MGPGRLMRSILAAAGILCTAVPLAFGQSPDTTAATVTLSRTDIITKQQLDQQVALLEEGARRAATPQERSELLDQLIARALIEQASQRDKLTVSDADVSSRIDIYRTTIAARLNLGRDITDAELQSYVASHGGSWNDFLGQVRAEALVVAFVKAKKQAALAATAPPSNDEVEDYYNYHKKDFVSDDMLELRHIFIDTRPISAKEDLDTAAKRAEQILAELKAGGSFEDLVLKYSEDTASKYKGGAMGILDRMDAQRLQLLGKPFFDAVFRLAKGETSGVVRSNIGYHIVQVVNRYEAALIGLDDKIPPALKTTTRDFIRQNLIAQRQNDAFTKAQSDVVADLKKQAAIKIY
jgi:parvulin-like peptidyl-prolyl isomerase